MRLGSGPNTFLDRFVATWRRTDLLFGIVAADAMLSRPIALRHPFIFYVGHLPAFAWNHICRGILHRPAFDPRFDEIFDRGIDPDVDDPSRCHAHPEVPDGWPALEDVLAYRDRVREAIIGSLDEVAAHASTNLMAGRHRVLAMVVEHELMHQETLLYMLRELSPSETIRPAHVVYPMEQGLPPRSIFIPEEKTTLGGWLAPAPTVGRATRSDG